jgi:hypothetical protein
MQTTMQKIVLDLYATVLIPLAAVAAVIFVRSLFEYRLAVRNLKYAEKTIRPQMQAGEISAERLDWWKEQDSNRSTFKELILFSSAGLAAFGLFVLLGSPIKVWIAFLLWRGLLFVSATACLAAIPMACHYALKWQGIKLGLCILAILMGAACAEHCSHQSLNARHIACPDCSDEDRDQE